jgi:DNA-binding NtrC family response regulator
MAHRRALVLEDDAALRDLLFETFASEDFEVRTCETFDELRAAAARAEADVVIADFWGSSQRTLSQSDGDDIRQLCSYLPVILLTGRSWASETTAEALGARALIRKPFDLDDLLQTIEQVVGPQE